MRRHIRNHHAESVVEVEGSQGDKDSVKMLVKESALERKRLLETSSVLLAAQMGDEQILKLFIESGADMSMTSDHGKTALHIAAMKGSLECVRLLLDVGANIDAKDHRANSVLHDATNFGHVPVVKYLVKRGCGVASGNDDGHTPLHLAALKGYTAIAEVLVVTPSYRNAKSNLGDTALHLAVHMGHEDMAYLLVAGGVDISATMSTGHTALYSAVTRGYQTIVELLIGKTKAESIRDNLSILQVGVVSGNAAIVKMLLDHGVRANAVAALYAAARYGNESIIRLLMDQRADLDIKDDVILRAFEISVINNNEAGVKVMLEHGAGWWL